MYAYGKGMVDCCCVLNYEVFKVFLCITIFTLSRAKFKNPEKLKEN
jgi:hypothetical protein